MAPDKDLNLYPDSYQNLLAIRNGSKILGRDYSRSIEKYFEEIFKNPVKIRLKFTLEGQQDRKI